MPLNITWAVPADSGYDWYALCYVLGFGLNLGLLVWEGHRRGYPMRSWLVLLACTTLMFMLGTKLLALSGPQWQELLQNGQWPASDARSVLGGALTGTLTLLVLRRAFGFGWHVFDAFALPMCSALVVQCAGCVLTGCCFGEPTVGSWGFTYPPGTVPYVLQAYRGLIPAGAAQSLPVHPTQLYALALCAGVGLVLVATRGRSWPGGSRGLLQLGLLLAGRGLLECWRDPASEPLGATLHTHGGLTLMQLQWVLLVLAPLTLVGWAIWVRRARAHMLEQLPTNNTPRNLLAVAAMLGLTAWLSPYALILPEALVVKCLLLTVLGLEAGRFLLGAFLEQQPARVALPLSLACTVLVLTSQAPADSARALRKEYYTISGGVSAGSFRRMQNTGSGGCGGSTPLLPYEHEHATGTLDLSHTQGPGTDKEGDLHKAETTLGLRIHLGTDQQTPLFPDSLAYSVVPRRRTTLYTINPYLQADRKYYGLGLGLLAGNLGYHKLEFGDKISQFDVQVSLRAGNREQVFALYDYNFLGYGPANPQQRLALGTGFGGTRWQLLAGGARAKNYELLPGASHWSGFVEAKGQIKQWGAGTFILFGNSQQRQAGFQLSRRLGNDSSR